MLFNRTERLPGWAWVSIFFPLIGNVSINFQCNALAASGLYLNCFKLEGDSKNKRDVYLGKSTCWFCPWKLLHLGENFSSSHDKGKSKSVPKKRKPYCLHSFRYNNRATGNTWSKLSKYQVCISCQGLCLTHSALHGANQRFMLSHGISSLAISSPLPPYRLIFCIVNLQTIYIQPHFRSVLRI